jgi:hypothetical protein
VTLASASAFASGSEGRAPSDLLAQAGGAAAPQSSETAERLQELATFEPKYFEFAPRIRYVKLPEAVLDAWFAQHTNMWEDDAVNLSYGADFIIRKPGEYDVLIGLDYTSMKTGDGYWLEDGDLVKEADFTTNDLSLVTLDASFHWTKAFDRQGMSTLHYGFGLGVAAVLGEFRKYDLDTSRCDPPLSPEERNSEDADLLGRCFDEQTGEPAYQLDGEGNRKYAVEDKIPPALPMLTAGIGFRQNLGEHFVLGIEGGVRVPAYVFTGINIGYRWETTP